LLLGLKLKMLQRGIRQTRMAVAMGWDPAKLSRIVNEVVPPSDAERKSIAKYLKASEDELFSAVPEIWRDGGQSK